MISLMTHEFSFITAKCKTALGMESGAILDSQITASSAHDIGNVGPQHARYVEGFKYKNLLYTQHRGKERGKTLYTLFSRINKIYCMGYVAMNYDVFTGRYIYNIHIECERVNMTMSTKSFSSHFIIIQHSILYGMP